MVKWFAASDHAGYELEQELVACLRALGDEVVDLSTGPEPVDYPDPAEAVARRVAAGEDALGLLVCGTGIGVAVTANKIPGVRAAVATNAFMARMARAHNDANVLALGARVIGRGVAEEVVRAFRETAFEGGRHERRVGKIEAIERAVQGGGASGRS